MTKEEWIEKCAAHFVSKGGCDKATATDFAEQCFNNNDDGLEPEEAAVEEMQYWEE